MLKGRSVKETSPREGGLASVQSSTGNFVLSSEKLESVGLFALIDFLGKLVIWKPSKGRDSTMANEWGTVEFHPPAINPSRNEL